MARSAYLDLRSPAAGKRAALDYPTRPVRWIVAYHPRRHDRHRRRASSAQWLSERLGQQFIIENKPGAGNNIGTEAVVNSPPDGYTVLLVNPANAINATLYPKLPFNFIRDIAPVAGIMRVPNVMEVNPDVPAKTVAEFIAYAKANPGKINLASSGNGTSVHLSGELFKMMTGVELHARALSRLGAGADRHAQRAGAGDVRQHAVVAAAHPGRQAARARGHDARSAREALPDVPTVAETVPGYEASAWFGMGAPKGTPPEIIEKLNKEINAASRRPEDEGAARRARRHADSPARRRTSARSSPPRPRSGRR